MGIPVQYFTLSFPQPFNSVFYLMCLIINTKGGGGIKMSLTLTKGYQLNHWSRVVIFPTSQNGTAESQLSALDIWVWEAGVKWLGRAEWEETVLFLPGKFHFKYPSLVSH